MSSPSSAGSHAGKRKRNVPVATSLDQAQPSSRDASGEEGESTAAEGSSHINKKNSSSADGGNPPSKRLRSSANPERTPVVSEERDPGEGSDTTEGSSDIAQRVGRNMNGSDKSETKTEGMAPPPVGKLTDPVGYKTNPPPVGRAVVVYADGVFDLFHLGYVDAGL
jgi:choline-phosphate cytidylyltransferase